MEVNTYSLSLTRRRKDNIITCTPERPFTTYERGNLVYESVAKIISNRGGAIVPTQISLPSNLPVAITLSLKFYEPQKI